MASGSAKGGIPTLDSTRSEAWSNGGKARKAAKPAGWPVKHGTQGKVERVVSWLKGQRALNRITVRSRAKVTVHCYLALIGMQT